MKDNSGAFTSSKHREGGRIGSSVSKHVVLFVLRFFLSNNLKAFSKIPWCR